MLSRKIVARLACACGILREQHVAQLQPGEESRIQAAFEYSDGTGNVLVKKIQAEPEAKGKPIRWIANGLTILNNKGKPVKQYEPYFTDFEHRFEVTKQEGVTSIIYYDAIGRTIRTEMPDGSFSKVEFTPWQVSTYDQNDTVLASQWYAERKPPDLEQPLPRNDLTNDYKVTPYQRAAWLAAQHDSTPALTLLDSLGREVIAIAQNRVEDTQGTHKFGNKLYKDEYYFTYTKLDAEGKPLWIRDARKNLVMQYITPPVPNNQSTDPNTGFTPGYDIAGNLLFHHSMDAGDRWMLNDAAGKPMFAWNSRGHVFRTVYDPLHRPIGSYVKGADSANPEAVIQFEKTIYGDTPDNGLTDGQLTMLNLRGKIYRHYDTAGLITNHGINPDNGQEEAYDFKGNLLRTTRQLSKDYKATPNWMQEITLEDERFTSSTRYDALNRLVQQVAPHSDRTDTKLNIIQPAYNEANLLEQVHVWLGENSEPSAQIPAGEKTATVKNIDYNAKGQRILIQYGNGAVTTYRYDDNTFRLKQLTTKRGNDVLQDLYYTNDPVGNITGIRDEANDRIFHSNQCVKPGSEYVYDALYRLTKATGREHRGDNKQVDWDDSVRFVNSLPNDGQALQNYLESYCYDAVGNILAMQHGVCVDIDHPGATVWKRYYQYAQNSNRLLATSCPSDTQSDEHYPDAPSYSDKYPYDDHGNMTAMPHLTLMRWDFKDQLSASSRQVVTDASTQEKSPETTYYVYDGSGQRVRKVTERQNGTRKTERIYLGGFEIYHAYNGNGKTLSLERETLHVMDDKQRIALVETRTQGDDGSPAQLIRYQLGNHLGSSCVELDDQARVISYEEYHPYGSTAYQAMNKNIKAAAKRYRYTGKEKDEETALIYSGARYYSQWLGLWVSPDPIGVRDGLNIYTYSYGNPLRFSDPSGKQNIDNIQASLGLTPEPKKTEVNWLKSGFDKEIESTQNIIKIIRDAPKPQPTQTQTEHLLIPVIPGRSEIWGGVIIPDEQRHSQSDKQEYIDPCKDDVSYVKAACRFMEENPKTAEAIENAVRTIHVVGTLLFLKQEIMNIKNLYLASGSPRFVPSKDSFVNFIKDERGSIQFPSQSSQKLEYGNGRQYSVAYRIKLPETKTPTGDRNMHNRIANELVLKDMANSVETRDALNKLIPNLEGHLLELKASDFIDVSKRSPPNWSWHHAIERGYMELVPRIQHAGGGSLTNVFHPEQNRGGGFKLWGLEF